MKYLLILLAALILCSSSYGQWIEQNTVHAVSGEPPIAQDYLSAGTGATGPNGETLRADDPNDPVDPVTDTYFPAQPYATPWAFLRGTESADAFQVQTYISGKPAIVAQHVQDDGTIDWNGVAGENDNVHDHWVEYFGVVWISGFNAEDGDTLEIRGHTVTIKNLAVIGGSTWITIYSQQGDGGGAHDEDVLGWIVVRGAELSEEDITLTGANDGIVDTFDQFLNLVEYFNAVANSLRGNQIRAGFRGWHFLVHSYVMQTGNYIDFHLRPYRWNRSRNRGRR